jgi:RNA polymerase sigma factor (sigma-70 family)
MAKRPTRKAAIEDNQGLVIMIAKRYSGKGVEFHELLQAGNLGLLEARARFDPGRNVKFCTYAYDWVVKTIKDAIYHNYIVRVPQNVQGVRNKVAIATASYNAYHGSNPAPAELASLTGETEESIEKVSVHSGKTYFCESDEIVDRTSLDADIEDRLLRKKANEVFKTLTEIDQKVLHMRSTGMTLAEVGKKLHYTRERVRQREEAALAKLRVRVYA